MSGAGGNFSISDQIKCVEREIALRERVYPRWVDGGKMSPGKAENELEVMRAVLATLNQVLQQQVFKLEG